MNASCGRCYVLIYVMALIFGGGQGDGEVTLYISVHVICRHLIDNAKIVKVFKSKITKSPIASQWAIRTQKSIYSERLDKTGSSKKNLTA